MDRISNFAKPLGIAMAVIGVAMVAISGYYLYAYMRSGSDAEHFNVDAAPPEDMLVLLGQGLPEPVSGEPVSLSTSDVQEHDVQEGGEVETAALTERDEDSSATVSIASILPDVGLVSDAVSEDVAVAGPKMVPAEVIVKEQPVVSRIEEGCGFFGRRCPATVGVNRRDDRYFLRDLPRRQHEPAILVRAALGRQPALRRSHDTGWICSG